jgi:hypothetical protein
VSDFVIFYARATAKQGEQVRQAERSLSYTGWRDNDLPAHRSFADVICWRQSLAS